MPQSTEDLIASARRGDRDAYDALFAGAAERLHMFVRLRLGREMRDRLESADVVQEAYLHAHRDFAKFEPQGTGAFGRWLCAVAENRMRDLADHQAAKKRCPPAELQRLSQVLDRLQQSATELPEHIARRELQVRVEAALETLDAEFREVLVLRFFTGLSVAEIAAKLSSSASSVRRRLGVAFVQLGPALGDFMQGAGDE